MNQLLGVDYNKTILKTDHNLLIQRRNPGDLASAAALTDLLAKDVLIAASLQD